MKKRILSLILAILTVFTVLPFQFGVSAKRLSNTILPFKDVPIDSWYYLAVNKGYRYGYLSGTSSTEFSPDAAVTRASFATVLAKVADACVINYSSKSTMKDIKSEDWYTQSVNWALENSAMSGIGDGKFGVNEPITREQLVLALYAFAKNAQYDTINIKYGAIDSFSDISMIHNWGEMNAAMNWAVSCGLISGKDGNRIAPLETTTRAELAVIMMKFLVLKVECPGEKIKINDKDISEYKIVYSEKASSSEVNAAKELYNYIYKTNGVKLEMITDDSPISQNEILVGLTNREGYTVSFNRSSLTEESFIIKTEGTALVIAGGGDRGTLYGVYEFLEKYLGWRFYTADIEICMESENGVSVSDICDIQSPSFEYRDVRLMTYNLREIAVKRRVNGPLNRYIEEEWGGKISNAGGDGYFVHDLNKLYGSTEEWTNCCISTSEANINRYMENITPLVKDSQSDIFCISAQDSSGYWCTCSECNAIAWQYRNYYDRWMLFVNKIAERIEEIDPNIKVLTLSYLDSFNKYGTIKARDNVIIMGCPITESVTSFMNSTANRDEAQIMEHLKTLCNEGNLYVWEYPKTLSDSMAGMPSLYALCEHIKYYNSIGVSGVFIEGDVLSEMQNRSGRIVGWANDYEFGDLKAYIASKLLWDATITDGEIEDMIVEFFQNVYGIRWEDVYSCFKMMYQFAKNDTFAIDEFNSKTETLITNLYTTAELKEMDQLMKFALSSAKKQSCYDSISMCSVQVDAMLLNRLWKSSYRSTDTVARNYIRDVNERMYNKMIKYFVYPVNLTYLEAHKDIVLFTGKTAKKLIVEGK